MEEEYKENTITEWIVYKYVKARGFEILKAKEQDRFPNEELALFLRNHIRAVLRQGAYVEKVTTITELIK